MNKQPHIFSGPLDKSLRLLNETQDALLRQESPQAAILNTSSGIFLEREIPADHSSNFLADVLDVIDRYEATSDLARSAAASAGQSLNEIMVLPQPLRDCALVALAQSGWAFAGPGVKAMRLDTGGDLRAKLLRIEPGYGAPNHDHTGTEYTLVVSGAFNDGTGRFAPGDLSIKRPGQIHHPIAEAGEICMALSVEEGNIALQGALGFIQRLFTRH